MRFKNQNKTTLYCFLKTVVRKSATPFLFFVLKEELYGERIAFYYRMNTAFLTSLEHCVASVITMQM